MGYSRKAEFKSSGVSRPRVISYLIDNEWGKFLDSAGLDSQHIVTLMHQTWDWVKDEMPESISFTRELRLSRYCCAIIPLDNIIENGLQLELLNVFAQAQDDFGLRLIVVERAEWKKLDFQMRSERLAEIAKKFKNAIICTATDDPKELLKLVEENKSKLVEFDQIKRRWDLFKHPAWNLHALTVAQFMGADKAEGVVVEADCGDGAMVSFLHSRLAKCKVFGVCQFDDERKMANMSEPLAQVVTGDLESVRRKKADYLLLTDTSLEKAVLWKDVLAEANKMGLMTIMKSEVTLPAPWDICRMLEGWSLFETLTHYIMQLEKTEVAK